MNHPLPSIRIKVDVTNPGQFFACCGLLELADRLWPGAEGWFEKDYFCVFTKEEHLVDELFGSLSETILEQDSSRSGKKTLSAILFSGFDLILDWWIDNFGRKTDLKLWAGQQTPFGILKDLQHALVKLRGRGEVELFNAGMYLSGRLGVDPRTAWTGLSTGFSPNAQNMKVLSYPAIELLAAIGLQGFRPFEAGNSYEYATWKTPLPTCVARAASGGAIQICVDKWFQFGISVRGSYKSFSFSSSLRNRS